MWALTGTFHQGKYTVTLIEGDGIGPEISQAVKDIYSAANVRMMIEDCTQEHI